MSFDYLGDLCPMTNEGRSSVVHIDQYFLLFPTEVDYRFGILTIKDLN